MADAAPLDTAHLLQAYTLAVAQDGDSRIQGFFQGLAASIVPPHVGHERKLLVKELLLRAEEAGLYKPEGQ